jgi:hypothetical protein
MIVSMRKLAERLQNHQLIRQSHLALLSFGFRLVQGVFAGCDQPLLPLVGLGQWRGPGFG